MRRLVLALALVLAATLPAGAVNPDEMLPDPAQEERARDISKGLRCLVCQNESIDESNAELAKDLRVLVRERISAGDSDKQVVKFVVDRYGDYVLLKPPFKATTLALWLGPAVLLLIAAGAAMAYYRGRRAAEDTPAPLSDEERRRLASLIEDDRS